MDAWALPRFGVPSNPPGAAARAAPTRGAHTAPDVGAGLVPAPGGRPSPQRRPDRHPTARGRTWMVRTARSATAPCVSAFPREAAYVPSQPARRAQSHQAAMPFRTQLSRASDGSEEWAHSPHPPYPATAVPGRQPVEFAPGVGGEPLDRPVPAVVVEVVGEALVPVVGRRPGRRPRGPRSRRGPGRGPRSGGGSPGCWRGPGRA